MAATAETLALALHYDRQGALQAAEQLYRQVLQVEPHHPDALYSLGMISFRKGRSDLAVEHLRQALAQKPTMPVFHCHLGMVYRALGRLEEAVACCEEALRLQPDYAEAHHNLGAALSGLGRLREATACHEQAVRCQPDFAAAHNNLGVAYQAEGKQDEAVASFQRALRLQPAFAEAYINLGGVLQTQGKVDEAVASFRQAVHYRPDYVLAHCDLATALYRQGRLEEAVTSFQHALRLNPNSPDTHTNLGGVLQALGKSEEALACYEEALRQKTDFAEAHRARAYTWLLAGDFERGWPEYEWRSSCPGFTTPPWRGPQPAWDGSPLEERNILLRAEQGLGDILQFIRYASLVEQRGGRVLVEAPARLMPLLRTCPGIDQLIAQGTDPPPFDVHALLLSLPALLGTRLATVPANTPYLTADPALVEKWRVELSGVTGFKVGIAWQGNPSQQTDRLRSVALTGFAPVAAVEGVHIYSLQKGAGTEQLGSVANCFSITDLGSRLDETTGAFMDTAAVLMNLDLVITVDTAMAHLAGALGVPVWLALSFAPDWRWLRERPDSPWYFSMRLFRQVRPGDWHSVFEQMAGEIRARLDGP